MENQTESAETADSFQSRVSAWTAACFGDGEENGLSIRIHRFFEEATELAQSLGCSKSEVLQLVEYVYARPTGEPMQEVGGVMVTLAALCHAANLAMADCGERELTRVWDNCDRVRIKQAGKPRFSPLPTAG